MYLWLWFRRWINDTGMCHIFLWFPFVSKRNKIILFILWRSVIYACVGNMERVTLQRTRKTSRPCIFANRVDIRGDCILLKSIVTFRIGWKRESCLRKCASCWNNHASVLVVDWSYSLNHSFEFCEPPEDILKKRESSLKQYHQYLCSLMELKNAVRNLQVKLQILK